MFQGAQFNYSMFISILIPLTIAHSGRERSSKPLTSNPALDFLISRSRIYKKPLYGMCILTNIDIDIGNAKHPHYCEPREPTPRYEAFEIKGYFLWGYEVMHNHGTLHTCVTYLWIYRSSILQMNIQHPTYFLTIMMFT